MAFSKSALLAFALAAGVHATHVVHFTNSCPFELTPKYKGNHDNPNDTSGPTLSANGGTGTVNLPEIWESGRIYPQDPKKTCLEPDGAQCTLVECNFGPADANGQKWNQCNLSLVSGYSIPTALGYVGGDEASCSKTFSCLSGSCSSTQAYRQGSGQASCDQCISECNTDGVGLAIHYCPPGSTIPDMGQGSSSGSSGGSSNSGSSSNDNSGSSGSNNGTSSPSSSSLVSGSKNVATPKKCSKTRAELANGNTRSKRGKLHFVGHYMGSKGSSSH